MSKVEFIEMAFTMMANPETRKEIIKQGKEYISIFQEIKNDPDMKEFLEILVKEFAEPIKEFLNKQKEEFINDRFKLIGRIQRELNVSGGEAAKIASYMNKDYTDTLDSIKNSLEVSLK